MYSLREAQLLFGATLDQGPSTCPNDLFEGAPDRILRALKVHANTISHGRLSALEESFPLTRDAMGEALFNRLTREFLEAGHDCGGPLDRVGQGLSDWLQAKAVYQNWVALARFEWLWLESYHSAEAAPLCYADVSAQGEEELLAILMTAHPSARILPSEYGLAGAIGIVEVCDKLLIVRPEDSVLVHAVDDDVAKLLAIFKNTRSLGSGIETFLASSPNAGVMQCMETLIAAGALTKEISSC